MERTEGASSLCFYLGMLPKSADRASLLSALSSLGKVIKARVARDQADHACKGYGYVRIEPKTTSVDFIQGCLQLTSPIIAFPIDGPKLVGRENTRLLRRFARIEEPPAKLSLLDSIFYLQSFGSISFMAAEVSKIEPSKVHRINILYKEDNSVKKLSAMQAHAINGESIDLLTYIGEQEYPFEAAPDSKIITAIGDMQLALSLEHFTEQGKKKKEVFSPKETGCNKQVKGEKEVCEKAEALPKQPCDNPPKEPVSGLGSNSTLKSPQVQNQVQGMSQEGLDGQTASKKIPFGSRLAKTIGHHDSTVSPRAEDCLQHFRLIFNETHNRENLRFNLPVRSR